MIDFVKSDRDNMMKPITICLANDNNYAQHGAVVIESILANHRSPKPLEIHYLDGGIVNEHRVKLLQFAHRYKMLISSSTQ